MLVLLGPHIIIGWSLVAVAFDVPLEVGRPHLLAAEVAYLGALGLALNAMDVPHVPPVVAVVDVLVADVAVLGPFGCLPGLLLRHIL